MHYSGVTVPTLASCPATGNGVFPGLSLRAPAVVVSDAVDSSNPPRFTSGAGRDLRSGLCIEVSRMVPRCTKFQTRSGAEVPFSLRASRETS